MPSSSAKRTRVIAVASQKGGVGKTAASVNLSAALVEQGDRVLGVDLDPQGHYSKHCSMREVRPRFGSAAFQFLFHDIPLNELIKASQYGFDVLAGGVDTAAAEQELARKVAYQKLRDGLADHAADYDWVIIDCPPNLGALTTSAMIAADSVIISLPLDDASLDGMGMLLQTIENCRRDNPALEVEGVLFNLVDTLRRTRAAANIRKFVRESQYGPLCFEREIRIGIPEREAIAAGKPVLVYDGAHGVSDDYRAVAMELRARRVQRRLSA